MSICARFFTSTSELTANEEDEDAAEQQSQRARYLVRVGETYMMVRRRPMY